MRSCERYGLRRLVTDYLADTSLTYAFDPDHAMLAYNLLLWRDLRDDLRHHARFDFTEEDLTYLRSLFVDQRGPLVAIGNLLVPGWCVAASVFTTSFFEGTCLY
jgi:hypothetical protein